MFCGISFEFLFWYVVLCWYGVYDFVDRIDGLVDDDDGDEDWVYVFGFENELLYLWVWDDLVYVDELYLEFVSFLIE